MKKQILDQNETKMGFRYAGFYDESGFWKNVKYGHWFIGCEMDLDMIDEGEYIISKLNYSEKDFTFTKLLDNDNLINFKDLGVVEKHGIYNSLELYLINDIYVGVANEIKEVIGYLNDNKLLDKTKILIQKPGLSVKGSAPHININYEKILKLALKDRTSKCARYYCDNKKNNGYCYADFLIKADCVGSEYILQFRQAIGDGKELYYGHLIIDSNRKIKHFDVAIHKNLLNNLSDLQDWLNQLAPTKLPIEKKKLLRIDEEISESQVFDILKLFFPLGDLVLEFYDL